MTWVVARVEGPAPASGGGMKAVTVTAKENTTGETKVLTLEVPTSSDFDAAAMKALLCANGCDPNDLGPCL